MVYASKHATDEVIGRGLLLASTIAQELRAEIIRRLAKNYSGRSPVELLGLAKDILNIYFPQVADVLVDTQIASWIRGLEVITARTPASVLKQLASSRFVQSIVPVDLPSLPTVLRFPKLMKSVDELISKGVMTRPQFDRLSDIMKARTFTVAYQDSVDVIKRIRQNVIESLTDGHSLKTFKSRLEEAIGAGRLGDWHLETVFRTNVQRSFSEGQEHVMSTPVMASVFPYARIVPVHDGRTRDDHAELETMGLNGTSVYRSDDPFWRWGTPPIDYNCFPGDTRVSGRFSKGYRALYEGVVVEIRTKSGKRLTVTPNHPVLTDKGWIPANGLFEGMNVFRASGEVEGAFAVPHNRENEPPTAADCFDAIRKFGSSVRRNCSGDDFYGDSSCFTSDVDIVDVNVELLDVIASNSFSHFGFMSVNFELAVEACLSSLELGLSAPVFSNRGVLGCRQLSFNESSIGVFPFHGLLFGLCSLFDAMFSQDASNYLPGNSECRRASFNEKASGVLSDNLNLSRVGNECLTSTTVSPYIDSTFNECPVESRVRNAILSGEFRNGIGGVYVTPDRIVDIKVSHCSKPIYVYDFESADQMIVANEIVVHNCRCSKVFMTIRQAAQFGVREAQLWLETGNPPKNPEYRFESVAHLRPTNGFVSPGALVL